MFLNGLACNSLLGKHQKTTIMKQVLQRLLRADDSAGRFQILTTIFMILLFLTFWGVTFYVLINSFA